MDRDGAVDRQMVLLFILCGSQSPPSFIAPIRSNRSVGRSVGRPMQWFHENSGLSVRVRPFVRPAALARRPRNLWSKVQRIARQRRDRKKRGWSSSISEESRTDTVHLRAVARSVVRLCGRATTTRPSPLCVGFLGNSLGICRMCYWPTHMTHIP